MHPENKGSVKFKCVSENNHLLKTDNNVEKKNHENIKPRLIEIFFIIFLLTLSCKDLLESSSFKLLSKFSLISGTASTY